jgi:hypothetical protein
VLRKRVGTLLIGAAVITGASAVAAEASDSTVTFTTTGGSLSITSAASAALTGGTPRPGGTVSGTLGTVTVTDSRGTAAGWTAGVYSTTGFTATGSPTITNAGLTYTSGATTSTTVPGSATITAGTAGSPGAGADAALTAYTYANTTAGGNIVSWNPTLAVVIPASAHSGAVYSGTISYRVV